MNTKINVTEWRAEIRTEGFGFNIIHRTNMPELWQWHEAVADMIANHHAGAMGAMFPCPEPVASTQEPKPKPAYCPECLCLFEHEDPSQSCRCGKPEPTGWRRWCANLARQIEERPDITPWRIIERAVNFPAVAEPCQPGEHKCEWNPDKTVLRCKKCGLDCT